MRVTILLALALGAGCATTSETQMKECGPGECEATKASKPQLSEEETALRKRGSFDLRCDEDKLHVTQFDSRSYGVEGCGRRTTYSNSCPDRNWQDPLSQGRCTWVQTGTTSSDPLAAPAAAK